jgi:hypothetical protein
LFASNIRREVSCVLDYFIFLKRKNWKKKNSQHVFDVIP